MELINYESYIAPGKKGAKRKLKKKATLIKQIQLESFSKRCKWWIMTEHNSPKNILKQKIYDS